MKTIFNQMGVLIGLLKRSFLPSTRNLKVLGLNFLLLVVLFFFLSSFSFYVKGLVTDFDQYKPLADELDEQEALGIDPLSDPLFDNHVSVLRGVLVSFYTKYFGVGIFLLLVSLLLISYVNYLVWHILYGYGAKPGTSIFDIVFRWRSYFSFLRYFGIAFLFWLLMLFLSVQLFRPPFSFFLFIFVLFLAYHTTTILFSFIGSLNVDLVFHKDHRGGSEVRKNPFFAIVKRSLFLGLKRFSLYYAMCYVIVFIVFILVSYFFMYLFNATASPVIHFITFFVYLVILFSTKIYLYDVTQMLLGEYHKQLRTVDLKRKRNARPRAKRKKRK